MNPSTPHARSIFLQAIERPPKDRGPFLDEACAGDPVLRETVERLLESHELLGSFHEANNLAVTVDLEGPRTEHPGEVIGPYKLLQQLGEGGMGVVYLAQQQEPVKRTVALKVIKPGMDTHEVIARFEAERQALALMDHPNIAKVLDAGATTTGRPFFVMELVKGVPITEYCDQHQLAPKERLELFITICQAVQHAHQKGIIHRDIKPSNVLVTLHDDKPVVKVIDFGIAKATSGQLTAKSLFTGFAQLVGTPLYMSPEQASLSSQDIDTRSDIYSLGVLLYELLTGTTPFDKTRLQAAAFEEIRRIIREEEPQKPSTRLSSLGATLPSVSAQRKMEPRKLSQLVRGDLDWIVMKAMEKDRSRRYETANGFAADVLHYLADEPVSAYPPSAAYRFKKFARRNKAALATGTLISATLVATVVILAVSNILVTRERNAKDTALSEKVQALGEKQAALTQSQANFVEAKRQEGLALTSAQEARKQQGIAQGQEKLARRRFYAAQMNLAMQAWEQGDSARTLELLEGQRPAFDQEDLRGFEWYYLWRNCHLGLRARLTQGPGAIQSVAFFPDGKRLASMGGAALKIWDVETLQEVSSWPNGGGPVRIAPDGKILASWSQWEPVKLWDTTSGRQVDVFQGTKAAAFAPDGKTIALVRDADVEFWDLATRERQSVLQKLQDKAADGSLDWVNGFIFSSDGKTAVVTVPMRSYAKLCRRDGGEWRETSVLPFHGYHLAAAFSPDGLLLAEGGEILKLYAADTGQAIGALTGHTATVYSVAFSPDGRRLASASNDRTVRVWDVATRQQQYSYPHPGPVFSVAFSPDGKLLASCGSYETLRVWDAAPSDETSVVKLSRSISGLAFAPDGLTVAACGDGIVSLIDVDLGQVQKTLPNGANSIAFSHNGRLVALGRRDGRVELWEMSGARPQATLEGHSKPEGYSATVFSVAFSPDDRSLASAGYDATVRVWDLATRSVRCTLRLGRPASAVAFSPDGRTIATGTLGENVRLWDAETGRELLVLQEVDREGNGPWCWSVAFSPDGGALATASASGQVRLWDTATAGLSASLKGHTAAVRCVAFSPDGNTLATAADERAIRLWDTRTGQETIILTGQADKVNAVAFSPDGKTLASGGSDGTVRFWRTSHEPAAVARRTELNPDDPGSPAALIDSASRLQAARRFAEAQQAWEAARARLAQLAAADPGAPEYKRLQAECVFRAGLALVEAGDAEHSEQGYQTAMAALAPLAKEFPGERRRIAQRYIELGRRSIGNTHVARPDTAFPPAIELFRALVRESPQDPVLRNELASALAYFGGALESRGRRAEAEEPYRQATEEWRELSDEDPGNEWYRHERAYFSFALANLLVAAGRHEVALAPCRVSVELGERNVADFPNGPHHAERLGYARNVLIAILSSLGRDEEAAQVKREQEEFAAAQSLRAAKARESAQEPAPPLATAERGWSLLKEEKFAEAEVAFREVIRLQPYLATVHRGLGESLQRQKKVPEAIAEYREAIRLDPAEFWAHEKLGWILLEKRQLGDAETAFREAIRTQPSLVSGHVGLGQALREQERLSDALVPLREAVRLDPSNHYGRDLLGWTLFDLKQPAEAEVEFREVVRLNAAVAAGHYHLASALREQNKTAEAVASLREALRLDPSMHYAHDNLGWMYIKSGEFAQAEADFREEIRLKPDLAAGHFGLARALVEQKRFPEAEEAARETIRLDPAHRWAPGLLNRSLKGQGKPTEQMPAATKESDINRQGAARDETP